MDPEWIRWGAGILITCIAGLVWYEIRRIGKNVHALRSEVGAMLLPVEADVRRIDRDVIAIAAAQAEAKQWRDVVLTLVQAVINARQGP